MSAEDRRQDRRDRLELAALELFADQGYAGTSIEQLCQVAAVSLRAFYEEYASKEKLFVALYDRQLVALQRVMDEALGAAPNQRARTRALIEAMVAALTADRAVGQVMLLEAGLVPVVDEHRRASHRAFADFLLATFPGLDGDGAIALATVGGVIELIADWLLHDDGGEPADLVDRVERFADTVLTGSAGRRRRRR